jgi:hypothetical protein
MHRRIFPRRFFATVVGETLKSSKLDLEIRCVCKNPNASPRLLQFWCKSLRELDQKWLEIQNVNGRGYDVHFTVVPRRSKRLGYKEHPLPDLPVFNCFWADIDVGVDKPYATIEEAVERIRSEKFHPNIIVLSGSGIHVYYQLKRPQRITRERAEIVLRAMADTFDGDRGAARATRLMRVPNTINWKKYNPKCQEKKDHARCVFVTKHTRSLATLESRWKSTVETGGGATGTEHAHDYFKLYDPHVKKLARSGQYALGLCPFHDDHAPSFSVNVQSGRFVCFTCGREGNWSQFRKDLEIPILEPDGVTSESAKEFAWENLPRFDPTKAHSTKWLVDELVPEGGITAIIAAPGGYKSSFTLLMADAVSKGKDFLDRKTRRRRVLYVDNENPPDVLKARNESMRLEMRLCAGIWQRGRLTGFSAIGVSR